MQFTWLFIVLALIVWRFAGWFHVLFTFATMKGRVLKNMATQYSFPPATPAQFPALDLDSLERYTREFEGMGFTRLLDYSLVSDSATSPPCFCRLMAHTRHHCFGEISQIFPKGKAPLPLKGSIQSCLQDGWSLAFSDRKPQAASSLIRRRKALGICMPEATPSELLQAFLKMREQVCLDLGIQTVNDDTLQAYINKMQRSATEMRGRAGEKLRQRRSGSLLAQSLTAAHEAGVCLAGRLSQGSRAAQARFQCIRCGRALSLLSATSHGLTRRSMSVPLSSLTLPFSELMTDPRAAFCAFASSSFSSGIPITPCVLPLMGGRALLPAVVSVPAAPVDGGGGGGAPPIEVLWLPIGDEAVLPPVAGVPWLLPLSPPEVLLRGAMIAWIDMGCCISPVLVMA